MSQFKFYQVTLLGMNNNGCEGIIINEDLCTKEVDEQGEENILLEMSYFEMETLSEGYDSGKNVEWFAENKTKDFWKDNDDNIYITCLNEKEQFYEVLKIKEEKDFTKDVEELSKIVRGELNDLGMEYHLEFDWDGAEDDGHFYIVDNEGLSTKDYTTVRNKLDELSNMVNIAYSQNVFEDIEELF